MNNPDNSISPEEFEVEKILDYRKITNIDPNTKKKFIVEEYLIKWLGYNEETWEPISNLDNCKQLLNEFKKNLKNKSRNKNSKSKISLNKTKSTSKAYNQKNKKTPSKKEKLTEIAKIPKSCLKIPKPKKMKNSKKNYLLQNTAYNAIKTKKEVTNLKEEIIQAVKDKNKSKIFINDKNTMIENFDKNRYVLYRCEIVEKPIFFDFSNIIPEKKNNYDKITFNEIFPDDDKFDKMENNLGKKRKRNNSLNSLPFICNATKAIKKLI